MTSQARAGDVARWRSNLQGEIDGTLIYRTRGGRSSLTPGALTEWR